MRISDWSSDVCSSDLPLMLAHVLETARPGEKLLLVGFGQGADALIFEITDAIDTARPRAGVSGAIANGLVTDSYLRMLSFSDGIDLEWGMRAEKRSEEHTSELQSLMRISYAVFGLKKKLMQII